MADQVTGNEGGPISYEEAAKWVDNYRKNIPVGEVNAYLYGINNLNKVLAQAGGCKGIRIHYAKDDNGMNKMIIFGVNANNEILTDYILEFGTGCPPYCSDKP